MPKYRLLTHQELKELEPEFIKYLIVNGITADDWEYIKKNDNSKAEEIIDLFSDVIFEGVMRKVKFLDYRSEHSLKTFQCLNDKIILVGIDVDDSINLLDVKQFNEIINSNAYAYSFKVYSSQKKYHKQREKEVFEMISNGCEISDGFLFKKICLLLSKTNEK